ncbi:MAG: BrnT family toxin [Deltaproteobacteria bacterium]|nr:BrnT family toxin [Deltaproteobacteria bacterium]
MKWQERTGKAQGFQWDSGNAQKSQHKHQVSCEEAEQIFFNQPLLLLEDPIHSRSEPRMTAFGRNNAGRCLTISFTLRGEFIRIISARPMNRKERKIYEEQNKR